MDINDFLSLDTFPKSYEACFLEKCAVREDCLHHLYFKLRPTSNIWGDAIFPSALMPENLVNGRCRMYQAKKLVTCYAGFSYFLMKWDARTCPIYVMKSIHISEDGAISIVMEKQKGVTFIRSQWRTMWKRYLWSMAITNLNTKEHSSQ